MILCTGQGCEGSWWTEVPWVFNIYCCRACRLFWGANNNHFSAATSSRWSDVSDLRNQIHPTMHPSWLFGEPSAGIKAIRAHVASGTQDLWFWYCFAPSLAKGASPPHRSSPPGDPVESHAFWECASSYQQVNAFIFLYKNTLKSVFRGFRKKAITIKIY